MNRKLTKFALMTNREIYRQYLQQLGMIYNTGEAAIITDWVFEKIAGLKRADIIINPDKTTIPEQLTQLNNGLAELMQYKPVQYVLGEAWFYNMKLKVTDDVLIPRPETEELVKLVVDDWKTFFQNNLSVDINQRLTMLDIGTGSGCIAIAIKKQLPQITMHAMDMSVGALSVAKENAQTQQTPINFTQADFLDEHSWEKLPEFDGIISNPPYIPMNEKEGLDKNVTVYEPHTALFVPDNKPFLFYEKIAAFGEKHLKNDGKIYVEVHENLAKETAQIFEQYYLVAIKQDIFEKERMLVITKRIATL
jgi:release factor glutamine methyltransferase